MELLITKDVRNPHSFTDQGRLPLFQLRKLYKGVPCIHESKETASW